MSFIAKFLTRRAFLLNYLSTFRAFVAAAAQPF